MRRRRVARVFSLGGVAATFVLWAVVSLQSPSLPPNPQPRSTIAVRPDRQALADGSTVELNANAKDTKDHPYGVWTLPPVRRSAEQGKPADPSFDRAKYDAIGESDRMTLRFRKPG